MNHPGGDHTQTSADLESQPQLLDEFFNRLCHYAGIGVIATNEDHRICFWNSLAALIFGASGEAMFGQSINSVIPADQRDNAAEIIERVLNNAEIIEFEVTQHDNAGKPQFLNFIVSPVTSHDGHRLGASFFIRDITRRKDLENRFAQTERMASLGTLAGGVAHHFNNILGGIVTSVDYAIESGDPLTARRTLKLTADAIARAAALVNNLLAFAEGDHRDNDLADLTETVCLFLDSIEEDLHKENIQLDFTFNTKRAWPVPFHQMLTVLRNLTSNAREAMPDGGILTLRIHEGRKRLTITVQDTGAGINETVLLHAFEPFFSTKLDPQTDIPRAGLGLAVVHGIVTDLGGSIDITKAPNQGSNVTVTLPKTNFLDHPAAP
jgi:PAS domain S-box-containing protein